MQRSNPDTAAQGGRSLRDPAEQPARPQHLLTRSAGDTRRLNADEISSQPSSSSLSSAAPDEIVTTGLRVQHSSHGRRRRPRLSGHNAWHHGVERRPASAESSQEEFEESESEEDRVLTSSNEHVASGTGSHGPSPLSHPRSESASDRNDEGDDDDDENATALGVLNEDRVFTPQPNAFSHPPPSQGGVRPSPDSYFPRQPTRGAGQRPSYSSRRRPQHGPYNMIAPSHQADHDAALRASLSTLLSCAAAARGLPKQSPSNAGPRVGPSRIEPSTLQIVPESVLMGSDPESDQEDKARRRSSSGGSSVHDKGKRKATSSPVKAGRERAVKKTRQGVEDTISPTLLTWVVSAGVVVLVSALSFSAGYAMGREAGMAEVSSLNPPESLQCGKDATRGLRRLRWSTGGTGSIRVA
ncbi:MAG: hypothetical protein M1833_004806 [Piccolia ochrophora]|nr:MAG: hypothetical protein M1833_004806 [Piccolia ochrophora]